MTGRTADRPRSGRPRVTTANTDCHLHILHICNRFLTDIICSDWPWTCHQSSHCTSSTTTAWYQGLSTIQRDVIDEATSMFTWTCQFRCWQHWNWQCVLFSNESRFQLFQADGRTRIYRRAGERTAPCCIQETVLFGGGSVMVVAVSGNNRQTLLSLMEILPHTVTCTCWTCTLLKHVLCGQIYSPLL